MVAGFPGMDEPGEHHQTGPGRRIGWRKDKDAKPTRSSSRPHTKPTVTEPPSNSSRKNRQNMASKARKRTASRSPSPPPVPEVRFRPKKRAKSSRLTTGKKTSRQSHKQRDRDVKQRQRQKREFAERIAREFGALLKQELTPEQLKQVCLLAFYVAIGSHGYGRVDAADSVSNYFSVHPRTVLSWAERLELDLTQYGAVSDDKLRELLFGSRVLAQSLRGRHAASRWLLQNPEKQQQARDWLLVNIRKPKLRAFDFMNYVNEELLVAELREHGMDGIAESTANEWMRRLGFGYRRKGKGVDLAIHERADVVEQRNQHVKLMESLRKAKAKIWFHDETVCDAQSGTSHGWMLLDSPLPLPAPKEASSGAIMLSDFLNEEFGRLKEAGLQLEIGGDVWFNTQRFLKQVRSRIVTNVNDCACRWRRLFCVLVRCVLRPLGFASSSIATRFI